jgi:competence protein ComFC
MPVAPPPAYRVYRSLWCGLDWLYPPRCAGCGKAGARWCDDCQTSVKYLKGEICPICGNIGNGAGTCNQCKAFPLHFSQLRSWAVYEEPLRQALHRLKYKKDLALGEALSRPLIKLLPELGWQIDYLLPVPLGVARLAERGYNQSALLAKPLALALRIPYRPSGLRRARETRSQVELSAQGRRQNVQGAFQADRRVVAGKRVLVIDDIATSCATLDACAVALVEADAAQVFCLTVARAGLSTHRGQQ